MSFNAIIAYYGSSQKRMFPWTLSVQIDDVCLQSKLKQLILEALRELTTRQLEAWREALLSWRKEESLQLSSVEAGIILFWGVFTHLI